MQSVSIQGAKSDCRCLWSLRSVLWSRGVLDRHYVQSLSHDSGDTTKRSKGKQAIYPGAFGLKLATHTLHTLHDGGN